jgi:hypothetical protein
MSIPTYAQVLQQINTYIVANGNNEITANILNPVLVMLADFSNNNIGDLNSLTTDQKNTIVDSINSLKQNFNDIINTGVQLYSGISDPNITPPNSYDYADFYMQVDVDDLPVQLWQYDGISWVKSNSIDTNSIYNNSVVPGATATDALNTLQDEIDANSLLIDKKLNISDYNQYFQGKFTSLEALQAAVPVGKYGDYAIVDPGTSDNSKEYIWDSEAGWVPSGSKAASTTDSLPEGSVNLYFKDDRVLNTSLVGLVENAGTIEVDDTVLSAFGKIKKTFVDIFNSLANKMNLYAEVVNLPANYTFKLGDEKKMFVYDNATTSINVFFEKNSVTAFPIGSKISICVKSAAGVTPMFSFPATNVNNTAYLSKIIQGETRNFTKIAVDQWVADSDLGVTVGTDAETQITSAVTEDNKVVSRLKLFNWFSWIKNSYQIITGNWEFRANLMLRVPGNIQAYPTTGSYPNVNVNNSTVNLQLNVTNSVGFGNSTTGSVRYKSGSFESNIVQNPLTSNRVLYYPDASGTVLLKETLTSLEISQFQKNGTLPMYIRVNNFTSDVLEDLRIILGFGTNIPYFQRCVLANANKGGGMWERAVSTVKLNNTNIAVSSLAINTGVLMQISDPLLFTWAVDTQSSKTGALVSELINGDSVKDVDDKTANNFRITFEVSYSAGAGDGTLELSIINPSFLVVDQSTETINIDGRGATKKRVVFNLRAVKTQDNNTGYRLRLNNGSKEITEYRLLNILRTNN